MGHSFLGSNFTADRPSAALLFGFFGDFGFGVSLFIVILVTVYIIIEISNKTAMMALGRSSEYHWNQIIPKSVHRFSRRSCLKLFSV